MAGATLTFEMVSTTEKWTLDNTVSVKNPSAIIPVPVISTVSRVFDDSMKVEIVSGSKIYYALAPMEKALLIYKLYYNLRISQNVRLIYILH